jgi:hypothetical protein
MARVMINLTIRSHYKNGGAVGTRNSHFLALVAFVFAALLAAQYFFMRTLTAFFCAADIFRALRGRRLAPVEKELDTPLATRPVARRAALTDGKARSSSAIWDFSSAIIAAAP